MKIMTILGTRPELIRLSLIIPKLDSACKHVLVHTGQNYDPKLKDVFFDELGIRAPDVSFNVAGSFGGQLAILLPAVESLLQAERPDRLLILGDTNSGLAAVIAKRMGIPVYHMEAGNRCHDDRVPEEVNRRIIDHSTDVWLPYTERSRQNLLGEGVAAERIYVTGNPIKEVMDYHAGRAAASGILRDLGLEAGGYFLATIHRAENVDVPARLEALAEALEQVSVEHNLPVVVSTHPRTRARLAERKVLVQKGRVRFLEPFGFADFIALERDARAVLSDSGTVQEECCIMHVPAVTLRDTTERPETIECGSNILSGVEPDAVRRCVRIAIGQGGRWTPPAEYMVGNVSDTVVRVLLGR